VKRVHVVVSGRVQGVWFRQSCAEQARAAGLGGWVRNLPDGRVEAALEGEQGAVDGLLAWMADGPPLAVVRNVDVTDEAPLGERDFDIR